MSRSPLELWQRPSGYSRNVSAGLPSRLAAGAFERLAAYVDGESVTELIEKAAEVEVQSEADDGLIRIADLLDIPDEFSPVGAGFYRCGHRIWELRAAEDGDGYVLARKHEERAVDLRKVSSLVSGSPAWLMKEGQILPVLILEMSGEGDAIVEDEQGEQSQVEETMLIPVEHLMPDTMSLPMGADCMPCPQCGCSSACGCGCHMGRQPSQGFEPEIVGEEEAEPDDGAEPTTLSIVRQKDAQVRAVTPQYAFDSRGTVPDHTPAEPTRGVGSGALKPQPPRAPGEQHLDTWEKLMWKHVTPTHAFRSQSGQTFMPGRSFLVEGFEPGPGGYSGGGRSGAKIRLMPEGGRTPIEMTPQELENFEPSESADETTNVADEDEFIGMRSPRETGAQRPNSARY